MGLFSKKMPEIGAPIFIDMRIAPEQLPDEVRNHLEGQMWFMGFPKKLSTWAIETLAKHNDPDEQIVTQDRDPGTVQPKKLIRPICIPRNVMDALAGNGDPEGLLLNFKTWQRTGCVVEDLSIIGFLGNLVEKKNLKSADFPALIVPDYSGEHGAPGSDYLWLVLLHPEPQMNLEYITIGRGMMLMHPEIGGYMTAVENSLKLFNQGKSIPGLVRISLQEDGYHSVYYAPKEVVEATGWWVEDEEHVPSTLQRKT